MEIICNISNWIICNKEWVFTRKLWEKIKSGEFSAVISDVTLLELERCHEEKRKILLGYLKEIDPIIVEEEGDDRAVEIASRFVNLGILREKSLDDCRHYQRM